MSKWVILKQDKCKYCDQALDLLEAEGEYDVEVIDLSTAPQIKDFVKACGLTTVPQVYLYGDRIGGYEDLETYFDPEAFEF